MPGFRPGWWQHRNGWEMLTCSLGTRSLGQNRDEYRQAFPSMPARSRPHARRSHAGCAVVGLCSCCDALCDVCLSESCNRPTFPAPSGSAWLPAEADLHEGLVRPAVAESGKGFLGGYGGNPKSAWGCVSVWNGDLCVGNSSVCLHMVRCVSPSGMMSRLSPDGECGSLHCPALSPCLQ